FVGHALSWLRWLEAARSAARISVYGRAIHVNPSLTGTNHKAAAAWNRGLVLRLLREHGQLSRRQVVSMVGLRGSTLTYIMRELMDLDIVRTAGKAESKSVGQKQVMLTINPDVGWALGVDLRDTKALVVIVDAAGRPLRELSVDITADLKAVPARLHKGLEPWLREKNRPPGRLLGIGVGVPAVVDTTTGTVVRSTRFKATGVPLQQALTDAFGVIAVIDHDACFGARAESAVGASASESHFAYLVMNHTTETTTAAGKTVAAKTVVLDSYGLAFFLSGRFYRGAHFAAGELTDALAPPITTLSVEAFALLDEPEATLPPALLELADNIARSLAMIANLVDISLVVLAGTVSIKNAAFLERVQQKVRSQCINVPGRDVRVVASAAGNGAVARGAALAALTASDETFADTRLQV
ncbi:MAG: hypothetical protein JWM57_2722, partial [Phycisphaerales bacterium]|nr:hypothetical protein [Phycisphaerales bacterium]